MDILRRLALATAALLLGPVVIILTDPVVHWSVTIGIGVMVITSCSAAYGAWHRTKNREPDTAVGRYARRCWRGDERLWRVFWLVGVGLSVAIYATAQAASALHAPLLWWIVALAASVPLEVWWIVSVWRCARNTDWKPCGVLAKIVVVLIGANYAYGLVMAAAYPLGI